MNGPVNLLFLCTGNSARSIMAEAILNHAGNGRFNAFSAGSHPTGRVNPLALAELARRGVPAGAARSKSWDEFSRPGSPHLDLVVTVCASAAGESCPVWQGSPLTAHWGMEDPAAEQGDEPGRVAAFRQACDLIDHRVRLLLALPLGSLAQAQLQAELRAIGRAAPEAARA